MKPTTDDRLDPDHSTAGATFSTYTDGVAPGPIYDGPTTLVAGPSDSADDGASSRIGPDLLPSTSDGGSAIGRGHVTRIEPGQTLYSKYRVIRRLGSGAMGEVWLVRHIMLKSEHALKLVMPNFASNPVALMRFQREFEVMASLRHEHAVIVYDAILGADGGYIDMEYVEGSTIHEVLGIARGRDGLDPSSPLMPLEWIVRILDQLCQVLELAHRKGIVHRDLKPSNLMLLAGRPPGREHLKVLDFGIAKIRDDPEAAGQDPASAPNQTQGFIGTPAYGSPEQALGQAVDGRSDLYAVGVLLYEFVTGRLPFQGNHWQVMSQNATKPPPSFAEANHRLRPMPKVEQVIFRMLAKDPGQRPRAARELYREFRTAVEASLPADHPPIPASIWDDAEFAPAPTDSDTLIRKTGVSTEDWPPYRPRRKSRAIVGALAVALALIVGLFVLKSLRTVPVPVAPAPATARPPSVGFERFWLPEYRPVEGYKQGMPWPEKVRRTTDQAVFRRIKEGIYVPETFEPDPKAGEAADGWPRVIVKNGIRFLRIPGGTWNMGAWDDPNAVDRTDGPLHPVSLTGFYLQETEVTNGQFEEYLDRVPEASTPMDWEKTFRERNGPDEARRYPAVNLDRKRILEFAGELGAQLPTEAQWEYAARSLGEKRRFVWGDAPAPTRDLARIDALTATPAPVASYPSPEGGPGKDRTVQGVFDLAGNVQELCRDVWVSSYRKADVAILDPCAAPGDPDRAEYVIRGAAYNSLAQDCATTRRDKVGAGELFDNLGFRLVVECPDSRKPR